jgi:site-specific DNA recombinase
MAKADQIRCAVYTRKSSEEGLEQSFNSLHAQREACESYIASQRHEGWSIVRTPYDDGGFSGGSMVRPALQQLLTDIKEGNVDVVVVYKIDRLTRSLFDFAKIVETFDAHKVSFVSVTQSFNTTTSMGRLTLNVLLSFAQFEREVTGERIRDKIAASKKKGMWMGGSIPLGYDLKDHKLVINHAEAAVVNTIFRLYAELGTLRYLKTEVDRLRLRTKHRTIKGARAGGLLFRVGHLSALLGNPTYRGLVRHKGNLFMGDHPAIIAVDLWDRVHSKLASNTIARRSGETSKEPSSLAGLLFDEAGNRMTPSHAVKSGKRYRYYVSHNLVSGHIAGRRPNDKSGLRIPAQELEGHVSFAIGAYLGDAQRIDEDLIAPHTPPAQRNHITRQARALANDLDTVDANKQSELMHKFVSRVVVSNSELTVLLDRRKIAEQIEVLTDKETHNSTTIVELRIPVDLRRVGQEKRLIIAAHSPAINHDPVLIAAIAKAYRWFGMLKSGEVQTMGALARAENVQRTYITSLLPLALLAPDITEAILEGRQPVDLSLQRFRSIVPLPIEWSEQRRVLGF